MLCTIMSVRLKNFQIFFTIPREEGEGEEGGGGGMVTDHTFGIFIVEPFPKLIANLGQLSAKNNCQQLNNSI